MKFILKKFGSQDFDDYFRLVNNDKVMAMITERVIPFDEAQRDYEELLVNNEIDPELGQFRILDEKHKNFIGLAKLVVSPSNEGTAELGYMLLPEYWGKGIGTQIADILIRLAEDLPKLSNLFAIIDPANHPSRKILINKGFISREFKDFDGLPGEVLERSC